jgi:hypothetical protein
MYVYMYKRMYLGIYVCVYVCVYVCMYLCVHVCMCVYIYSALDIHYISLLHVLFIYVCVCVYVCVRCSEISFPNFATRCQYVIKALFLTFRRSIKKNKHGFKNVQVFEILCLFS